MKHFGIFSCLIILGFLLVKPIAQANPCSDPKRLVNGHTVNLQPLIDWWAAPKGVRPLSAWQHIQGSITQDSDRGWVVTAKGFPSPFLLKNPPRKRLLKFEELQKRLAECTTARNAAIEFLNRPVAADLYSVYMNQSSSQPISLSEYREGSANLAVLTKQANALRAELAPMQNKQGNFKVDVFALDLHRSFEGRPVFEYGLPQPQP